MGVPVFAAVTPHPPIIVPEVGRGQERVTQATLDAYAELRAELGEARPQVLVFICPHGPLRRDEFVVLRGALRGNLGRFGAQDVRFERETDTELVAALLAAAGERGVPLAAVEAWEPDDHSLWVPLYHLGAAAPQARVLLLAISFAEPRAHHALGEALAAVLAATPKRVAIVASADGAHALKQDGPYGYHPMAPVFEEQFHAAFEAWDQEAILSVEEQLRAQAAEDSIPSLAILMGALAPWAVHPHILASEAPWGVGYMTARVGVEEQDPAAEAAAIVGLARAAVESHLGRSDTPLPAGGAGALDEPAGAFVSIHTLAGELRGCIGTVEPRMTTLAEEIAANAVAAATSDPRFAAVRAGELTGLTYKVDVLEAPEAVAGASALDPARYGLIVENGARRGLLLPALEGIESAEAQIRIAREKAGIDAADPVALFRFRVTRYEEGAAGGFRP